MATSARALSLSVGQASARVAVRTCRRADRDLGGEAARLVAWWQERLRQAPVLEQVRKQHACGVDEQRGGSAEAGGLGGEARWA